MASFLKSLSLGSSVLVLVAAAGCSAKITGSNTCTFNGETHEDGDTFDAGDGCNTCQCSDGEAACTLIECAQGCVYDGGFYEVGQYVSGDECSECTCAASGQVECVESDCCGIDGCGCEGPVPTCDPPPGNCWYDGPYCDGFEWTCGNLVCDDPCASEPPPCAEPPDGDCWVQAVCDDFEGWTCVEVCRGTCSEQYPEGYATAQALILQWCGCDIDSPCAAACLDPDGTCGGTDACAACVQEQQDNNSECELSAVVSDDCQSDPQCADYVECELASG